MPARVRITLLLVMITIVVLGLSGLIERPACGQQVGDFGKSRDWATPGAPCPDGNGGCAGFEF